jgi:hypothetical protein
VALPKAAQKQLADAEKLHAEVYPDEPPKLEEVVGEKPDDGGETPAGSEGDQAPNLSEVPAGTGEDQANVAPAEGTADQWKHKYDVLKGKYDAEVPRLQQSNNAMSGRMSELESQVQQMLAQQVPTAAEPIEAGQSLVTAEEVEDYGSDMIDVVKRAAREEFAPMLATLQQENDGLRQVLGGMQQSTALGARDEMMKTLDSSVSNWRELNGHSDFLGWLENVDPYSGQKKLDMLRTAFEGNNTSRVLAFFKGFLNENAAFTPNPAPNNLAQPQVSLDTLVAPGRPSDGNDTRAQDGNATGSAWTQQEITAFYRDVNRGVYRNNPAEKDRLEADIFLAQSTGNIT